MAGQGIKLITFDAYLTLFKPVGSVSLQYAEEAGKLGVQITKTAISQHYGPVYRNHLQQAPLYGRHLGMSTRSWWEKTIYEIFITAGAVKKDLDPVYNKLFNILWVRFTTAEGYTVFPDVPDTLAELKKRGFKMGVVSNTDDTLEFMLKDLNLTQYFDFILPSCVVGYDKPDPRIYKAALEIAGGNIRPDETLHVGDDIETDFHGPRNAGFRSTLLKRVYNDAVTEFVSEAKLSATEAAAAEISKQNASIPNSIASLNELCDILSDCQRQPSTPTPSATTTAPINTPSSTSTVSVPV
ncbi:hypothetical protein INT45_010148 [Circinella minor]|uniref:Haloacid dehalogenase-like hydrolase domain-containing protein 3 n=1 Tax=Circinella minor TaxID=1195481 RepID=A0A8H7VTU7_9FUNG|nr:hypothetical protein INT45_010148 [Circinella minor]